MWAPLLIQKVFSSRSSVSIPIDSMQAGQTVRIVLFLAFTPGWLTRWQCSIHDLSLFHFVLVCLISLVIIYNMYYCICSIWSELFMIVYSYYCGKLPFWQVIFLVFFSFLTEACLFVVYSFHSPQVLLEFCGFMQLSAVSFVPEFSHVLWSAVFQLRIL